MAYIKVVFNTDSEDVQNILIAVLSEQGYEGFEQQEKTLEAFAPEDIFDADVINRLSQEYGISYDMEAVKDQNWNASWEENFQPVIIDDFCSITAHFHKIDVKTEYHISITPKMSFGTGHHATTKLMIKAMRKIDFAEKKVFDFGTGTGLLAILANQLGAKSVLAIDNDEWAYNNASDNILTNNAGHVTVKQAELDDISLEKYDIILANINRHILLQYMQQMKSMLQAGGLILMSGLLAEDRGIIVEAANEAQLNLVKETEDNNWIALLFK